MVYLDVYNSIFEYLEDRGIVDDVFEYAEKIINPIFDKIKSNEMMNEIVAELALFNYMHKGKLLIDFLAERLYPKLDEYEKEEFDLIKASGRFNLKFNKKEKINQLDTKGKELYDFHFHDLDNNESKVIVSSTALDELSFNLNTRLIKNPNHKGKFSIIGGIFEKNVAEAIPELSAIKLMKDKLEETNSHIANILEFGKKHNLDEIDNYKNEKSAFLEQDKKIMKINRQFFEKFDIGFDDFLRNFFELSNNHEKFTGMAEYYISVADELKETILDTNYSFPFNLLSEKSLISGFVAFIKKDKPALEKCISELRERGKKEFENDLKNGISLSRENIIKSNKKFLTEQVAPLKPKSYDTFLKKIDTYHPDQIKDFLSDIVDYLEKLPSSDEFQIPFFTAMTKDLLEKADEIPYLKDVQEEQKDYEYNHEKFYDFLDVDDDIYNLLLFLSTANLVASQKSKAAYELLKENGIAKTKSLEMMFLIGRIFSFFGDDQYKKYFNEAKRIDKGRYKNELESFLEEKEKKIITL